MRILVTGASGFVGTAVVSELISAGHEVVGLARSEKSAALVEAAGAIVHRGDLEDLESLRAGAAHADAVIHTGFIHDFSRFAEVCAVDKKVIETIGTVLAGSNKPFLVTSGTALVNGQLATEDVLAVPGPNPRIASELAVDALAQKGVRVGVVRLPPSVHGIGDHGFVPMLINIARQKGIAVYKDEGLNLWPAVHRLDAAKLYRLAIESAFEAGTRFHAVAEKGIAFKEIAKVIGKRLNVPVVSKSGAEAAEHFEWFTHFASLSNPASSQKTQEMLGWTFDQPGLIADIDSDDYFTVA